MKNPPITRRSRSSQDNGEARSAAAEHPGNRYFRLVVFSFIGMIMLTVIAGLVTFLLTIQGAEQTMVPDLVRRELVAALIDMQERGLNSYVQLRFDSDPELRGRVIEQEPAAGTLVRAGRQVNLVVSQGAVVDRVENFIGRQLEEVRSELQILFASFRPLLQVGDIMFEFDESEPGTILRQSPEPNSELAVLTNLDLVVSRGPDIQLITLPAYTGINFREAMNLMARSNVPFVFTVGTAGPGRNPGTVYQQEPAAGTPVAPGSRVRAAVVPPTAATGQVFGVLSRVLPTYAVPIDVSLDIIAPDGERTREFTMSHPGGEIGIPYRLAANSTLVLSAFGSEILRHVVRAPEAQ